jgi:ABC-type glucose/galactose transport system permease subunit
MSTERHDPHGQEIVRRVGERVPLAFGIFLACVGIATFFEFVRFPERRLVMGGVAALYGVLVLAAYTTVVRRPGWAIPVLVGTINVIGVVINVYHARVDASVAMCVWVLTALLCGSAVMFPWGRRAQALASLGALLSYPINLQAPSVDPHTWAAGGAYLLCVVALSVFGASLLGGFSLRGGEGSVVGVVLGVMLLQILQNLVNLLGIPSSLNFAVMGAVILIGVLADQQFARYRERQRQAQALRRSSAEGGDWSGRERSPGTASPKP